MRSTTLPVTAVCVALGFGGTAQFALAQDVSSDQGRQGLEGIDEVVVTATKRGAAAIQDVPLAIQALSADALQAKGAIDFADFYRSISGLSVQDEGPGDKRYIIRGVNSSGAGTVGVYLDENIITGENAQNGGGQSPDIKLFDLERVEVLKGPQGTTFGSSSMSGTIRYITKKANVDDWSIDFQSALRSTDGASLGLQTDGALNAPIVPGVFALRVSGFYADLPGFISNRFHEGANSEKSKAGRLQGTLKITDDLTLSAMAMLQDVEQNSKNYFYRLDYAGNAISRDGYQQPDVAGAPAVDQ
jgi:outer membrane receptor protein involved in Fe transport